MHMRSRRDPSHSARKGKVWVWTRRRRGKASSWLPNWINWGLSEHKRWRSPTREPFWLPAVCMWAWNRMQKKKNPPKRFSRVVWKVVQAIWRRVAVAYSSFSLLFRALIRWTEKSNNNSKDFQVAMSWIAGIINVKKIHERWNWWRRDLRGLKRIESSEKKKIQSDFGDAFVQLVSE